MIMKTLHFGIEMEMTGITRSRAQPAGIFPEIFATIAKKARIQYKILPAKNRYEYQVQPCSAASLTLT